MLKVFLLVMAIVAHNAEAASPSAASVRILFSTANASHVQYSEIVSSTSRQVKGLTFFSTSPNPIQLAVGADGSEVVHLIIPQGTLPGNAYNGSPVGSYNAVPHYLPIAVAQGRRLAIKSLNSIVDRGELQMGLIYF